MNTLHDKYNPEYLTYMTLLPEYMSDKSKMLANYSPKEQLHFIGRYLITHPVNKNLHNDLYQ